MSEFKPITTQEELDLVIRSRIQRERKKIVAILLGKLDTLEEEMSDLVDRKDNPN